MRGLGYMLSVLAVVGLAVWAYGQSHMTQTSMNEARELRREIRQLREAIEMQRAEWAFLNRPERLRLLVEMNFERLGLVALTSDRFGRIDEIAYPMPALPVAEVRP